MNNKLLPILLVAGGFFAFAIWRNPVLAAQDMSDLTGNVAGFLQDAVARVAEFLGSLG